MGSQDLTPEIDEVVLRIVKSMEQENKVTTDEARQYTQLSDYKYHPDMLNHGSFLYHLLQFELPKLYKNYKLGTDHLLYYLNIQADHLLKQKSNSNTLFIYRIYLHSLATQLLDAIRKDTSPGHIIIQKHKELVHIKRVRSYSKNKQDLFKPHPRDQEFKKLLKHYVPYFHFSNDLDKDLQSQDIVPLRTMMRQAADTLAMFTDNIGRYGIDAEDMFYIARFCEFDDVDCLFWTIRSAMSGEPYALMKIAQYLYEGRKTCSENKDCAYAIIAYLYTHCRMNPVWDDVSNYLQIRNISQDCYSMAPPKNMPKFLAQIFPKYNLDFSGLKQMSLFRHCSDFIEDLHGAENKSNKLKNYFTAACTEGNKHKIYMVVNPFYLNFVYEQLVKQFKNTFSKETWQSVHQSSANALLAYLDKITDPATKIRIVHWAKNKTLFCSEYGPIMTTHNTYFYDEATIGALNEIVETSGNKLSLTN